MGVLVCFLFTISIHMLYQGGKIKLLEWDIATITAGDYTVEFHIHPDGYRFWYNHEYRKAGGDYEKDVSPGLSLKKYIINEVEGVLTKEMLNRRMSNAVG